MSLEIDDALAERSEQTPVRRKCQYCKQQRDCQNGPDPFLALNYDEIELVWLCDECFDLREHGLHLDDDCDEAGVAS